MNARDAMVGRGPVLRGRAALARSLAAIGAVTLSLAASLTALPLASATNDPLPSTVSPVVVEPSAVTIEDISPLTVTPADTVTVRVTVRNMGTEPIAEPTASLSVVRYRLQSRTQLREWFADELALPAATRLTTTDLEEPLAPGESRSVTLSVPAEELRLLPYPEASGPRGIVVELGDRSTGTIASARSFLLWFPEGAVQAARLSILVPVTGPAATPTDPEAWTASMSAAVAPSSGRLARVLEATAAAREVSWVVDPALVDAAAADVGGAGVWASTLLAGASGREVFALDPFDPDVAALAAADVLPFQRGASATSDAKVRGWRDDLALPVPGSANQQTLAGAAAAGDSLVVVDGGLEPVGPTTASGVVSVPTGSGTVRALVPDDELNRLFATATPANRQLLLAELAVIAQEQPGRSAHVLITAGRDWAPDVAGTSALLASLAATPFVTMQPVATLAGAQADEVVRQDLPDGVTRASLSPRLLRTAADQLDAVTALAGVVPDPDALTATYTRDLAAATSVAAAQTSGLARRLLADAIAQGDTLLGGISVLPGSTVNLINDSGAIPITVRNDLPQAATVTVALVSRESRLSVEDVRETTIEPGATADVQIPVRAIGSGDVRIAVQIRSADGTIVAAPAEMNVRVRAGWETVGTAIIGGLLVLLLVGGIVRTVRRGRSAHRMEPIRPADPDDEKQDEAEER